MLQGVTKKDKGSEKRDRNGAHSASNLIALLTGGKPFRERV